MKINLLVIRSFWTSAAYSTPHPFPIKAYGTRTAQKPWRKLLTKITIGLVRSLYKFTTFYDSNVQTSDESEWIPQSDKDQASSPHPTTPPVANFFLCQLLRDPTIWSTHKFHKFKPGAHIHATHTHTLKHSCFCKERYCTYHDSYNRRWVIHIWYNHIRPLHCKLTAATLHLLPQRWCVSLNSAMPQAPGKKKIFFHK